MSSEAPTFEYVATVQGRVAHIRRSKWVAMCGKAFSGYYRVEPEILGYFSVCPKCEAMATPAGPTVVLPPPDGSVILGRWEIELEGSPPRPNQTMRGGFSKDPAAMEKIRRMRLAMQGNQSTWKKRTGAALLEARVPKGLGFIRLSSIFYRANPASGDDQGDVGAIKAITDAIVKYGCVPDDSRQYVQTTIPESKKRPEGRRKNSVRIIIEQLGRAPDG